MPGKKTWEELGVCYSKGELLMEGRGGEGRRCSRMMVVFMVICWFVLQGVSEMS